MGKALVQFIGVSLLLGGAHASARPPYLDAWEARYSQSTLPARRKFNGIGVQRLPSSTDAQPTGCMTV